MAGLPFPGQRSFTSLLAVKMGVFSSAQARSEEFCTKGIFFNITPLRFHHCFMAPEAHQGITGRNGRVGVAIANTYLNTIILESNTITLKARSRNFSMATAKRTFTKKTVKRTLKSTKAPVLSVVTVRISDEEKFRIDEIMRNLEIKRYSDIMRMALHMVKLQHQQG